MMPAVLEYIVEKINEINPLAAKKLKKNYAKFTQEHKKRAEDFFQIYSNYLNSKDKTIEYAIDCYLKMIEDMYYERLRFIETGKYSNSSYKEVNEKIYSKPEIMNYHMHGLILAQFLWPDQYIRLKFFSDNLPKFTKIKNYLEVGGGHGLYAAEALKLLDANTKIEILDISPSSLEISRNLVKGNNVNFVLNDIFEYPDSKKFDFITAGEVIEHLENPELLLCKLKNILSYEGTVYLTTPVNSPMIDHIYLFNDTNEIKALIRSTGFEIINDVQAYSDDMPEELAMKYKIPLMYACFLKISK